MASSRKTANITKPLEKGLEYVRFYDLGEHNGIFSNYHNKTVTIGGNEYKTAEHYFQCMKFSIDSGSWQEVFNAPTPNDARIRAASEHNKDKKRKDDYYASGPGFDAAKKAAKPYTTVEQLANSEEYKNMLITVATRAEYDPEYASMLDASGDCYILEDTYQGPPGARNNPDSKWGGGADGMGDNLLGLALMEVRADRKAEKDSTVSDQAVIRAKFIAMREQAREERKEMDKLVGGASETRGKKLTDIASMVAAVKSKKTTKSSLTASPTTPKSGRGPNFIREIKKIEAALKADGWTAKPDSKPKEPLVMQKGSESFAVHPNKFTTESSDKGTFVAMLKAFKAANPGKEPHVTCDQAEIEATWQAAIKEVYPGITKPDIKVEGSEAHKTPRP